MSEIEVSIIVVSDWIHPTRKRSWKHELECLEGIAGLDFDLPIEVILVDDIAYRDEIPFAEATRLVPGLIIELVDHRESSRLKDRAVQLARGRYVAMFEADCVPEPDWLRRLYELLSNAPDVAGVSGKTVYAIDNSMDRVLTLLDRGFNDEGRIARTPHLSNNASLCRREFLLRYPYPDHPNPFVSGRQRIAMMSGGGSVFMIDPEAVCQHDSDGWSFIRDVRRNTGFSDYLDANARGVQSVRRILLDRLSWEWADVRRLHHGYLRWNDWPVLLAMLVVLRLLELPGILDARRGLPMPRHTGYR